MLDLSPGYVAGLQAVGVLNAGSGGRSSLQPCRGNRLEAHLAGSVAAIFQSCDGHIDAVHMLAGRTDER